MLQYATCPGARGPAALAIRTCSAWCTRRSRYRRPASAPAATPSPIPVPTAAFLVIPLLIPALVTPATSAVVAESTDVQAPKAGAQTARAASLRRRLQPMSGMGLQGSINRLRTLASFRMSEQSDAEANRNQVIARD